MKSNKNTNRTRKQNNRIAIFYKSHGKYIGPYGGETFSKKVIDMMQREGTFNYISNYILRSPLQFREVAA